jgi:MFS family permease
MGFRPHGRWMRVVITHAILLQVVTYAVRPAQVYALLDAESPTAVLGLVSAAFTVPALFLALPSGRIVERLGERPTAMLGGALFVVACATALFGRHSVALLFLSALLLGVGHLLSMIAEQTAVANRAQPGRLDSTFALYTLAVSLGQATGPLLLALPGASAVLPPVDLILGICTGLAVALAVVSLFLPRTSPGPTPGVGMFRSAASVLREPGATRALVASSIALSSVEVTLIYLPALGEERNLPPSVVGFMLVARSLSTMASRAALGSAVRRFGRRRLMVSTLGAAAVAIALIGLPLHPAALIVLAGVFGFFVGICQPITMSWLTELAPPGRVGMTMSLRLAGNRVGQSTIPGAAGLIAGATGVAGALVAVAASLVVAAWASAAVSPGTSEARPAPE